MFSQFFQNKCNTHSKESICYKCSHNSNYTNTQCDLFACTEDRKDCTLNTIKALHNGNKLDKLLSDDEKLIYEIGTMKVKLREKLRNDEYKRLLTLTSSLDINPINLKNGAEHKYKEFHHINYFKLDCMTACMDGLVTEIGDITYYSPQSNTCNTQCDNLLKYWHIFEKHRLDKLLKK
jgi:hypothetical protein